MNLVSDRPHRLFQDHPRRLIIVEGVVLAAAAPLLLIPERWPTAAAIALLGLAAVWLVSLLIARPLSTPFDVALVGWGLALGVGIVVSADPEETIPKATGLILGLAVWRYAGLALGERRRVGWGVGGLLLLGLSFTLVGAFGLQEMPKIDWIANLNPFRDRTLPGLAGLTVHPNQLAGLICLYLPVIFSLLLAPRSAPMSFWRRLALWVAMLWTIALLIMTQSRGGWIGAVAGLFILLVLWALLLPRTPYRAVVGGLAVTIFLLVAGAVLWIGPADLRDLWLNPPVETVVGTLSTLNYRKELWPWAATAVSDFPFTGVGLGAFRLVVFRLYPLSLSPGQDIGHAHNIFLQTALDVGLPGLVAYLAILIVAAMAGWRVARHDAGLRAASLGLLAGLAAVHVFGLADALALGSKPGIVFWLALGLLAAMNRKDVVEITR